MAVAWAALRLGAGRTRAEAAVDHAVGFTRLVKVGARLAAGDLLGVVHANDGAELAEALGALAGAVEEVWQGKSEDSAALQEVHKGVRALGYGEWCETDYRVVRGLAYYTGVVFEVHDRAGKLRAVAGGGRYDDLLKRLGGEDLPAVGFGMGDAVLAELLREKKTAVPKVEGAEIFVVAEGSEQEMALGLVGQLRRGGFSADYDPGAGKWGKQLEMAEAKGARWALLVGREVAEGKLGLKELASRKQSEIRWTKGGDGKICLEPTPGDWAKVVS
jgi:histidyl-tRNA synthetase